MLDALKALTSSRGVSAILYAWIFPSAVFVAALWLFVLPYVPAASQFTALSMARQVLFLLGTAIMLGILLSSISMQLSRILEGYLLWPRWLQTMRVSRQRSKRLGFMAVHETLLGDEAAPAWRQGLAAERIRRFPELESHIAPTRFGNSLRALETYGISRFEFDSQLMWSELLSVAPDRLVDAVHDAADATNFFVAFVILGFAFGVVTLVTGLCEGWQFWMYWRTGVGLGTSIVAYMLAVSSVDGWKNQTQALVNLGRRKLAEQMGLAIPVTIDEERAMWIAVRNFVIYGREQDREALNPFRKRPRSGRPLQRR